MRSWVWCELHQKWLSYTCMPIYIYIWRNSLRSVNELHYFFVWASTEHLYLTACMDPWRIHPHGQICSGLDQAGDVPDVAGMPLHLDSCGAVGWASLFLRPPGNFPTLGSHHHSNQKSLGTTPVLPYDAWMHHNASSNSVSFSTIMRSPSQHEASECESLPHKAWTGPGQTSESPLDGRALSSTDLKIWAHTHCSCWWN
jgi:hypothetical protein